MSTARILLSLTLCGLLVSCADLEFVVEGGGTDEDGDGYSSAVDCNDNDKVVFPGAKERENCRDDNCNGKVDEDTANEDVDGDGYCPNTGDVGTCEGNSARNPGMPEDGGEGTLKPNGIDDNCNGKVDDGLPDTDLDGDGYTLSGGDCNDEDPAVNPGAIEVVGIACNSGKDCAIGKCYAGFCRCVADKDCSSTDACSKDGDCPANEKCDQSLHECRGVWKCLDAPEGMGSPELKVCRDDTDNDCDNVVDEYATTCDTLADLSQTEPLDFAKAIELCDTDHTCDFDKKCPGGLKCVNNVCRRVLSATFNSTSSAESRAIALEFAKGGPIKPPLTNSFIILSTGLASYDAKSVCTDNGTTFGNSGTDPDKAAVDPYANDLSELTLQILVPTNARSFSFDFMFFTSEYPEYLFTAYNDSFWAHLDSKKIKGNISFDSKGTPIRVNNAFFDICDADLMKHPQPCGKPASTLTGTGYGFDCPNFQSHASGGATEWLTTTAPVEPGETITLTFSIFDKGDFVLDSSVIIDNFRWSLSPAAEPTTVIK